MVVQCWIIQSRTRGAEEFAVHIWTTIKILMRILIWLMLIPWLNVMNNRWFKLRIKVQTISIRRRCGWTKASRCFLPIDRPWWRIGGWRWGRMGRGHRSRSSSWRCWSARVPHRWRSWCCNWGHWHFLRFRAKRCTCSMPGSSCTCRTMLRCLAWTWRCRSSKLGSGLMGSCLRSCQQSPVRG